MYQSSSFSTTNTTCPDIIHCMQRQWKFDVKRIKLSNCYCFNLFDLPVLVNLSHIYPLLMSLVVLVCQGERGPIGPAMLGPRGIPGIPGERGEQVSVTLVSISSFGCFLGNHL